MIKIIVWLTVLFKVRYMFSLVTKHTFFGLFCSQPVTAHSLFMYELHKVVKKPKTVKPMIFTFLNNYNLDIKIFYNQFNDNNVK